jgi:hypothetical protein
MGIGLWQEGVNAGPDGSSGFGDLDAHQVAEARPQRWVSSLLLAKEVP